MTSWLDQTMIIERLFGVGLYSLVMSFFYVQVRGSNSVKAVNKHFNWYLLVIVIMGFAFIPAASADIYRWRQIADGWMSYSLTDFFIVRVITSDTPLGYLMIYLCQKTGINGILPGLCALIFYANTFHIFKETYKREGSYSSSIAVSLLFFMAAGSFLEVISGVRCFVAFSIVTRCIFDEIICSKSMLKSIVPYIAAVLMHTAVLPLIAIRLIALLFEKKTSILHRITNILALILTCFLAFRYGNDYIDASLTKASNFIYGASTHYSYIWEYIIGSIQYLVIGIVIINYYRRYRHIKKEYDDICRIMVILAVLEIALVISYSIFHRFLVVSSMLCIPIMSFEIDQRMKEGRISYSRNIIIVSLLILFLACVRGNLCGYKFFLL